MVLDVVQRLTGNNSVTGSTPFMDAGLDSLDATRFVTELSDITHLALSPTLVFVRVVRLNMSHGGYLPLFCI